jgi:DNA polymerase III, subunit gamma and tau
VSSYRVFARKYRPQTFEQVVGQEHITRTLQNAIAQNRLAQAYLFVGPRGIGKTSTARILARALNCEKGPTVNPCGVCDACREIAEGNSLDVLEIDGASNNSVDHVRELRENAAYQPARGPYKIYLVDEVHMLSTAAFNALLKTLEEPPPHVKFIFATTEAQKVPATITSRCQRFDLRRIPADLIAAHLQHIAKQENVALDDAAAGAIAKGADGGLRDAESMLDQLVAFCGEKITAADVLSVFGFTAKETVEALCERIFERDAAAALAIVAEQAAAGRDLARLMGDMISHLRDLLVRSVKAGDSAGHSDEHLLLLLDHFAETETRLRWATDRRLYFDVAVIKAVHMLGETTLSDVIDTLVAIGGGVEPPSRTVPQKPAPAPEVSTPRPAPAAPSSRVTEEPPTVPVAHSSAPVPEEKPESIAEPVVSTPLAPPAAATAGAGDLETVWRGVAESLSAESFFQFGWLVGGKPAELENDTLTVEFPETDEHYAHLANWDDTCRQTAAAISKRLGRRTEFACKFTAPAVSVEEPPPEPEPEPAPAAVEEPPQPEVDPAEDFKNDPLIRKALELFKARIEAT